MDGSDGFRPATWVRSAARVARLTEQRAGRSLGRLDEQEVRRRVSRRLERPVVGDDPGLRMLLADLGKAPLTPLGRAGLRSELVRRGVTEGLLQDELRRRPGILHTPVHRPLVVVGLPRTGTTLLHALLGCDPAALVLPFWQLRRPYPIPRGRLARARRIVQAAALAGLAQSMAPRPRDVHPVSALRPEEDVFLFRDTGMLAVPVVAPGYLRWLQEVDPAPGYRTYRRHLQALLHDRPGRRAVLKSPFHLGGLGALLAELPEAMVVQTTAIRLSRWRAGAAWRPSLATSPAGRSTWRRWAGGGWTSGRSRWIGPWRPGPPPIQPAFRTWPTRRWWPTRSVRWSTSTLGWVWSFPARRDGACPSGSTTITTAAAAHIGIPLPTSASTRPRSTSASPATASGSGRDPLRPRDGPVRRISSRTARAVIARGKLAFRA